MTRDELADHFKEGFDALHAEIDTLPEGAIKVRIEELTNVAHRALDRARSIAAGGSLIQPMSGGGPKG